MALPGVEVAPIGKGDIEMDKDRVAGAAQNIKGKVKESVGKALGDSKLESEGKVDKVAGKVRNTIGGIKDKVREATEDE
jgi:uncharacterized protein YjbJ (UPF0337 family)